MKRVVFACFALFLAAAGAAYWWYWAGPRAIAERWVQCDADRKALVTERDKQFWDEARAPGNEQPLSIANEACLGERVIETFNIRGLRAVVKIKERWPDLSWQDMTEFPAAATKPERIALLRERASQAKGVIEGSSDLVLVLEQLRWRIDLNLEKTVLLERQFRTARDHRKKGAFEQAVVIYEAILGGSDLTDALRKRSTSERLETLAEKACITAARQYLKFPDASDYRLQGIGHAASNGKIFVVGEILAPNAFGVKGKFYTSCDVTFPAEKPQALVDLFMIPPGDGSSPISKKNIEVHL